MRCKELCSLLCFCLFHQPLIANNVFSHSKVAFGPPLDPNPPENITVGAYYYPWWYQHFQVSKEGYLRKKLNPRQEIRIGQYDDRKASVVRQHLAWSKQANIQVWISSWWGPQSGTDLAIRDLMFTNKVDLEDHKIALLYETTGRIKKDDNGNYNYEKNVASDFNYICQQQDYFSHGNYYKINGRPVIAIYLTRALDSNEVLDDVVQIIRDECDNHNVYIIGDHVWGMPPDEALDHLDAITNYDMYGNMGQPRFAGQNKVNEYYSRAKEWKEYAAEHQAYFIPNCSPGYNDRGVRLKANHTALSRRLDETHEEGSLLAAQLKQAISLLDPGADYLLLVNSFNEWHEDTQIEPCDGPTTTEPFEMTEGLEYTGYGTLYLDILATYTLRNASAPPSQLPVEFTGPTYGAPTVGAYYWSWHTEENYKKGLRANLNPGQTSTYAQTADVVKSDLWISWQSNVTLWITPWNKPYPHITDVGAASLFDNAYLQLSDHKLALHYNVYHRLDDIDGILAVGNIESDIAYICDKYLQHPNYYRTSSGTPVLFLGLTRAMDSDHLEVVIDAIRTSVKSAPCEREIFLVGDEVWGDIQAAPYIPFSKLNAVMNHDVYGNMGGIGGYAGRSRLGEYYETQRQWRIAAWQEGCAYIPTVLPGFNDRSARMDRNHAVLSRVLTVGDEEGSFFSASLQMAKHLVPPELDNLLLVNSLNHFAEDTQIYPVCGSMTNQPNNLTQGFSYTAYGTTYLDILTEHFGSHITRDLPYSRYGVKCTSDEPVILPGPTLSPSTFQSSLSAEPSSNFTFESSQSPSISLPSSNSTTPSQPPSDSFTPTLSFPPSLEPSLSGFPSADQSIQPSYPRFPSSSPSPTFDSTPWASNVTSNNPSNVPSDSTVPTPVPSQWCSVSADSPGLVAVADCLEMAGCNLTISGASNKMTIDSCRLLCPCSSIPTLKPTSGSNGTLSPSHNRSPQPNASPSHTGGGLSSVEPTLAKSGSPTSVTHSPTGSPSDANSELPTFVATSQSPSTQRSPSPSASSEPDINITQLRTGIVDKSNSPKMGIGSVNSVVVCLSLFIWGNI